MLPEDFPAITVQVWKAPIHTTFRAVRATARLETIVTGDGSAVRHIAHCAVLANRIPSAIGTPLEWPEAKKVASHVRSWGIEV